MGMVVVQAHAAGIAHLDILCVVVRGSLHKKQKVVVEAAVLRDCLAGNSIPLLENGQVVPSRSLEAQYIQEVLDQLVQKSHREVPSNWVEASPDREVGQSIGYEAGIDFVGMGDLTLVKINLRTGTIHRPRNMAYRCTSNVIIRATSIIVNLSLTRILTRQMRGCRTLIRSRILSGTFRRKEWTLGWSFPTAVRNFC